MGFAGRILHDLDLTDAQKRQIHDMVRSHVDGDLHSLIRDFGEARHGLEILVWDPSASDRDIATASDTLARSSLALEKGRRSLATDILGALTAPQRQKFHEMLASAKPPMPPPPPGPTQDEPDSGR
jgi:Spy/CpxP family protein refolding chaperone